MSEAVDSKLLSSLAGWRGGWAEPWDYSVSHGTLRIKIARMGADACVVLTLKNCSHVSFASSWEGFDPQEGAYGPRFRVKDSDRLGVDCGAVRLAGPCESYADIPPRQD